MGKRNSIFGTIGAVWGLMGILALLLSAILRLWPLVVEAFSYPLTWYHRIALLVIALGMAYFEGYKGFQMAFSPRTAARARYLLHNPRPLHIILSPFFCMGYFHATKRRKITSISLTLGIILLVIIVRFVPQPWRGIIDLGVVVGLAWGIVSLLAFSIQSLGEDSYPYSPEVPDEE
jgi:hypothetical protein